MSKTGFVYLLGDWEKECSYKIGVTTGKIENRIKKLQTGNSGEIYIIDYFESQHPFFVEKWLHKHFIKNKISGEWYKLSVDEISCFKECCEKYEKLYEYTNKEKNILNYG